MKAKIEWVTGILRMCVSEEEGAPYDFVVTVVREGSTAYLKGAVGTYNRQTYKLIIDELKALGIKTVVWERKNNNPREIRKEI